MFVKLFLPQLPNAEFIRYLKRSEAMVAAVPDLPPVIAEETAALGTVIAAIDHLYLNDPVSLLTQELTDLDDLRDKRFSAFAQSVSGAAGSPDAAEVEAATLIARLIEVYGGVTGVTRCSDDAETTRLENFVADCRHKPEVAAALRSLGFEGRINDIESINQQFERKHVARSEQAADSKLPYNMLRKRKEAKMHYDELTDLLNGAGKLARGAEPWAGLAARWNQEVGEFAHAIAVKKGRAAAATAPAPGA